MEEEKKVEEKGTPPAPSAEPKSEDEPSKEEKSDTTDYKAELQKLNETVDKRLNEFGFGLRKIEDKMKEEGWELGEEKEGLTDEKVKNIVAGALKEQKEEMTKLFKSQVEEILQGVSAKNSVSKGAGAGQKTVEKPGPPKLSPQDQRLVEKSGLKWNPTLKEYVGKHHPSYKDL